MRRGKKIAVLAHCILNQNAVVRGLARAPGAFANVVQLLLDYDVGIYQLPCPEFTFLGEARPSRTRAEYDTPEYRAHCRILAGQVAKELAEYVRHGYRIAAFIGIQESPSCDTLGTRGIFLEILLTLLADKKIHPPLKEIPLNYVEDPHEEERFLLELEQLLVDRTQDGGTTGRREES